MFQLSWHDQPGQVVRHCQAGQTVSRTLSLLPQFVPGYDIGILPQVISSSLAFSAPLAWGLRLSRVLRGGTDSNKRADVCDARQPDLVRCSTLSKDGRRFK